MGGSKAMQINIQEIATVAAKEALKQQKDEERQRTRKNRFHNTELLLNHYLDLQDHYNNSKDSSSDVVDLEELDVDEVIIYAIKRSKKRTKVMINQIETSIELLKIKMARKNQSEKYEVIYRLYLDPARRDIEWGEKMRIIAQELYCSTDSVRRWKNEMIRELSVFLFGVDGLQLEV
jgi:tRNA U34 5-carboxymethylaminomethyl modifying enzyme MnmG/GidA